MTITAQTSKTGPYSGNGTTTVFSYTFEVQEEAHLVVTLADSQGVETVQVLNTDYTVSGVGNANGGLITMSTAPASTYTLTISRNVPITQEVDLENRRSVAPEVLEDAYDKLTQIAQDLNEQVGRSLKISVTEGGTPNTSLQGDVVPGSFVGFGLDGNFSTLVPPSGTFISAGSTFVAVDAFTGNGITVAFTMGGIPASSGNVFVYIDGVMQDAANYSVSGTTLTFSTAPPLNSNIEMRRFQGIATNPGATTADLVTYSPAGTGAVSRTVEGRLRDYVSIRDFGVVANDTDQTAAIVSVLTGLGSSWEGVIEIPRNIRFDFNQVIPVVPYKAIVKFTNTMQSGSGYRQQLTGIISNPPDANTDTAFSIIDPHYPDLMLNNPRTAGTQSASKGLSGFSWGRGFFKNGTKGPRFQWQANFTKSSVRTSEYGGEGVACFEFRTRAPERAGDWENWFNGIVVAIGDYVLSTNGAFYKALTAGTSTVAPTFTSGTSTVGGVTWEWQDGTWVNFRVPFYVDELGRIGSVQVPAGFTQNWEQNPEDPENMNLWWTAKGTSKRIQLRYRPTDSGDANVLMPIMDMNSSDGMRMLDSTLTNVLYQITDARGFELAQHGRRRVTATDGDTTPSVVGTGRLVLSNTSATSITNFDDFLPTQEVELYFTNGNTTLVHSSALFLRNTTNVTPINGGIIVVTRDPTNNGWVEKSRNF